MTSMVAVCAIFCRRVVLPPTAAVCSGETSYHLRSPIMRFLTLSHLRVQRCVHLVGCRITPRTSCFCVLTTSPGLPDSDRPKNEFVLCRSFIVHMCASFSRFSPVGNRRRQEESRRSPVKTQASARVDGPTAPPFSFAVRTKESNACASVCANAWI